MTGNKGKFITLTNINGGKVTFGDNAKGKVVGKGKVGRMPHCYIDDVLYVEGLKHNLLSISQFCDKGNQVIFNDKQCLVINQVDNQIKLVGKRINNIYMIDLESEISLDASCLVSINDDTWTWHRRFAHASMDLIQKLSRKDLVIGLPKLNYIKDKMCDACQKGKQVKSSFKSKKVISTSKPLDLLHMDLIGPSRIRSYGGNSYILVIVDDYSRFTWTLFLKHKSDTFEAFCKLSNVL